MTKPPTNESESDFRRHVDDWNFSTETVFRISKLLEDFRHEFRRSKPTVMTRLLADAQRLDIDFVRRVFTSPQQDKDLLAAARRQQGSRNVFGTTHSPLCFQFTGSSVFERFRKSGNSKELKQAFKSAMAFLRTARHDEGGVWSEITRIYRACYQGTTLSGVIDVLEAEASRLGDMDDDAVSTDDRFRVLSLLFVFYSRINIAGEASATLAAAHFSHTQYQTGNPDAFAYLIESDPNGKDLALLSVDCTGFARPVALPTGERPPPIIFPDCGDAIGAVDHKTIRAQFIAKCYPLFNPEVRQKQSPSGSKPLIHLVIPVYEIDDLSRAESDGQRHIVAGPFLGWLFILLDAEALRLFLGVEKDQPWENRWKHLCSSGGRLVDGIEMDLQKMRFALNRFSELYLLGEMEWAIEQPWMAARDPAQFTTQHYHHCDGWMEDRECAISVETITSLNGEYSVFCNLNGGRLRIAPESQADVTHIIVDVGRGFGVDEKLEARSVPIILKRRPATALPISREDREFYRGWLTGNVRQFYSLATMRKAEQNAGRATAAEEAYAKTAHQLRKLTRHIHESTTSADLDALRRYLSLTFLHPKSFIGAETVRLAHNINDGGEFGPEFLKGKTLEALVRSAYRYASCLYPLLLKLHNAASTAGTKPQLRLNFSTHKTWRGVLWSHQRVIRETVANNTPIPRMDSENLQCKAYFYVALVALWLNIMEHSPRRSVVSISVDENEQAIIIKNVADQAVREHGSTVRSLGTSHTLEFYFGSCFPANCIVGKVIFPEEPQSGTFTTRIPLPFTTLCHHS